MLNQLLMEIRSGSALGIHALAEKLMVSDNQVVVMLDELTRMGLIKQSDVCQPSGCSGCPVSFNCALPAARSRSCVYSQEEMPTSG
jgi:predicted ArsR family transcriptional regulator